jgi:hypothetical protein
MNLRSLRDPLTTNRSHASLSSGLDGPYGCLDELSSNFFKPGMSLILYGR